MVPVQPVIAFDDGEIKRRAAQAPCSRRTENWALRVRHVGALVDTPCGSEWTSLNRCCSRWAWLRHRQLSSHRPEPLVGGLSAMSRMRCRVAVKEPRLVDRDPMMLTAIYLVAYPDAERYTPPNRQEGRRSLCGLDNTMAVERAQALAKGGVD